MRHWDYENLIDFNLHFVFETEQIFPVSVQLLFAIFESGLGLSASAQLIIIESGYDMHFNKIRSCLSLYFENKIGTELGTNQCSYRNLLRKIDFHFWLIEMF